MRIFVVMVAAALAGGSATFAFAQHQHSHDMSSHSAPDARELVPFPAALVEVTLANMRDQARGSAAWDVIAKFAWSRGGFQIYAAGDAGRWNSNASCCKPVCGYCSRRERDR